MTSHTYQCRGKIQNVVLATNFWLPTEVRILIMEAASELDPVLNTLPSLAMNTRTEDKCV